MSRLLAVRLNRKTGALFMLVGLLALAGALALVLASGWNPAGATSHEPPPGTGDWYMYSAKVVCSPALGKAGNALTPGTYYTAVNVHNPWERPAQIKKWLTLSRPQGMPAIHGSPIEESLEALGAVDVDCPQMKKKFGLPTGSTVPGGKGFLAIESDVRLDVAVVYTQRTTTTVGAGSSMDVEYIKPMPFRPAAAPLACELPYPSRWFNSSHFGLPPSPAGVSSRTQPEW
jgi:hypothetical protein